MASISDVGMRRTNNQDAYALVVADSSELWQSRGNFFLVADGMGAHAAGELASKLAADGVLHLYLKYREESAPDALARAICETNAEIHRRGTASPDFHNMGTTCSTLLLLPQGAIAAHIGDSRIYRLRGQKLEQLTFDHSLQWELQASGQLPPGSDLAAAVPKNVITRSLGPNATVQLDLEGPHPIEVGDVYLLCSDGLTARVEDAELGPIMAALPPEEAARALVDLGNLRGGPDNITIIIARVVGPEIATAGGGASPLTIGGDGHQPVVHPVTWIAAGVCVLAAVVMLMLRLYTPAIVAAALAAAIGLFGVIRRYGASGGGTSLSGGRMLGRGPYSETISRADHEFLMKLAHTVDELREAAREGDWVIDWRTFDDLVAQALAADKSKQYAEGVRHFCRAITFMMNELRSQPTR
ncbi:MAG TPA: protein phosphatase 2C domain-containing protein [Pirellulaceae bacterium]|nr:protein phosphatase 2C domain-containing protein [Pirellulaceae bacterium]